MNVNRHRIMGAACLAAWLMVCATGTAMASDAPGRSDLQIAISPGGSDLPVANSPGGVRKVVRSGNSRLTRLKALARQELAAGRFPDAYHRLRPNVGEARGDGEYLALLALAALRVGSFAEAMVIYERLCQIDPGHGRWHLGLALAREQLGLDAVSVYREALALIEDSAELRTLIEARLASAADEDVG